MKYSAIAGLVVEGRIVGYRIIASESYEIYNRTLDDIKSSLIKEPNKFANFELREGKVELCNGIGDRYPLVNNNTCYKNENKATIVGAYESKSGEKQYSIVNYTGAHVLLKEADAIKYGDQFGYTNGKIVNRGGTKILSSISGTFEEIKNEMSVYFDKPSRSLMIWVPEVDFDGTLTVPVLGEVFGSMNVKSLLIIPKCMAGKIETLVLNEEWRTLTPQIFDNIANLKNLVCKADYVLTIQGCLNKSKIESMKCVGQLYIGNNSLKDCVNLREIEASVITGIDKNALGNALKLDIDKVIRKVSGHLKEFVCSGCHAKEIHLGRETRIGEDALRGIVGLEDIYVEGNFHTIFGDEVYKKTTNGMSWFTGTVHLAEGGAFDKSLDGRVKRDYIKRSKKSIEVEAKSSMTGEKVSEYERIESNYGARTVFRISKQEDITRGMIDLIKTSIGTLDTKTSMQVGEYNIEVGIPYKIRHRDIVDQYINSDIVAVKIAKKWIIFVCNRQFMIEETKYNEKVSSNSKMSTIHTRRISDPGKIVGTMYEADTHELVIKMHGGKEHRLQVDNYID